MDRKFNFFVVAMIVLVTLVALYGVLAIYKVVVFQGIYKTVSDNVDIDNYAFFTEVDAPEGKSENKYYYKKGVAKDIRSDGTYVWSDGESSYLVDDANKKIFILSKDDIELQEMFGENRNKVFANLIPGYNDNLFNRIIMAIDVRVHVRHEEVNGNKVFRIVDGRNSKLSKSIWIDVTTKKPVKGEAVITMGGKSDTIKYNYTLTFLSTKEKDIALPVMNDYQVLNYKTGEVVAEPNSLKLN